MACINGNLDVVKILIKAGANVNLKDGKRTSLTIACLRGYLDFTQKSIEEDFDVNFDCRKCVQITLACYTKK